MTKATNIDLDAQKEKGKIVSYTVTCLLTDEDVGNGKRRLRFSLDEAFVKGLPNGEAAKNTAIGTEIKALIKKEHTKWVALDAKQKAKVPPVNGADLKTKIGFDEMVDSDFE